MSIVNAVNAPAAGPELVVQALQDLLPHGDSSGGRTASVTQDVQMSKPIPIYRLPLNLSQSAAGPQAAEQVGWRYVVKTESEKFGVVDLKGVHDQPLSFVSLSENTNADLFVEALHIAQDEARKSASACEIRSLDMPSLYISAIWVTSEPPSFIPYIAPNAFPSEVLRVDYGFVEKLAAVAKAELARGAKQQSPDLP